jgi:uncharacterized protein (DUF1501 family)
MKRRDFIKSTSVATVGGMAVQGIANPLLAPLGGVEEDRVLVIVQLFGGNDGLNTVIPLDQYSELSNFRSNVLIPDTQVLPLSGTGGLTGLHPSMSGMKNMWDDGKLSIVQAVGYPNPNFSHFRSTDIWETGADWNQVLDSGWVGRYLNYEYPNYPTGFPNTTMPDPLAIRIGGIVGTGLYNQGVGMGIAINNTDDPLDLVGNMYNDPTTADCKGDKLAYLRDVQRQTDLYGDVIEDAAIGGCNMSTLYPTGSAPGAELAQALKIVAQLICGGLKTRIYWVSVNGFDTHAQQVDPNDHAIGVHADLLQGVSNSIAAFQDDLNLLGLEDRVMGMTFSEFGRRITSNGSIGTDHGAAAPMFLFGTQVIPGILGTNPVIDPNTNVNTNVTMQYDFRSVYGSILRDWFCLDQVDVDTIMLNSFQSLALVDPAGCLGTSVHDLNQRAGDNVLSVYPNPFVERTNVQFETQGGLTILQVFTEEGKLLKTLANEIMPAGMHTVDCDLGPLPTGIYYCRLQNLGSQQVRNMLKVR